MAVPGHDARDYAFAHDVRPADRRGRRRAATSRARPYDGDGVAVNSGFLDGLPTAQAKDKITAWLAERGVGARSVAYKLRDWLFSRQRYWGEPFPVLHTEDGQVKLVPESELPVELPELDDFKPQRRLRAAARARARLGRDHRPRDRPARALRDTNTMPQWAGSCWYYLRFCDPHNDTRAVLARSRALLDERRPVRRRRGARGAAPAVRALLAQGAVRPRASCTPRSRSRSCSTPA